MKKANGLTLVELLGVIVVLGILALISVPQILNLLESAKKQTAIDSALGYVRQIDDKNKMSKYSERYEQISNGEYDVIDLEEKVDIKGERPLYGQLTVAKGTVSYANLCINGYIVQYQDNEAKLTGDRCLKKSDLTDAGIKIRNKDIKTSEITIDYLIENDIPIKSVDCLYKKLGESDSKYRRTNLTLDDDRSSDRLTSQGICNIKKLEHKSKYKFKIVVRDVSGFMETKHEEVFETVEILQPEITMIYPESNKNEWYTKKVLKFTGEAYGAQLQYQFTRNNGSSVSDNWLDIDNGREETINYDVTFENNLIAYLRITDGTNTVSAATMTVTKVDINGVSADLETSNQKSDRVTLTASCSALSGLRKIEFSKDGGTTWDNNGTNTTKTYTKLNKNSEYDFKVRCTSNTIGLDGKYQTNMDNQTDSTLIMEPPTWSNVIPAVAATKKQATITYSGENIASPVYFIKGTVDSKSNVNLKECGITQPLSESDCGTDLTKDLTKDKWYMLSTGNTITISSQANGSWYGVTSDGTNTQGSSTLTMAQIDTEIISNISTSDVTTKSVKVTATCSAETGIRKIEFSKDNGSTWVDNGTTSTYTFTGLTTATTYDFKVRCTSNTLDTNNNINSTSYFKKASVASSVTTVNINNPTTAIQITTNVTTCSKSRTITVKGALSGTQLQYKLGSGDWTNITDGETFTTAENTTIYARLTDSTNSTTSAASLTLTKNGDTTAVTQTAPSVTSTINSVTVTNKQEDNCGIGTIYYAIKQDGGSYGSWQTSNKFTTLNGTKYYVKTKANDVAGNGEKESSEASITTAPINNCTITPSSTDWQQSKTYKIEGSQSGTKLQYKIGSGSWTDITSGNSTPTQTANQSIYCRLVDTTSNSNYNQKSYTETHMDTEVPTVKTVYAGGMIYTDPTFASGSNSVRVYNNQGNGTVTHERKSGTTPEGSYYIHIKTNGTASPGLGGFSFANQTAANKVYVTRIVAKIPKGYNINWHSNEIGSGGTNEWLTSQAGTGAWQEYINVTKCGSSGSFSSTNYFALSGAAGTSSKPVEWDVAYATVIDTTKWAYTGYVVSAAQDSQSGVAGYGINQSSSTAPSFTTFTANGYVGKISSVSANGTYYAWYKDKTGRTNKGSVSVSYIDRTAPTVANNGTISTTTAAATVPIKITESQSGWASTKCEYGTSTSYGSTGTGTSTACSFSGLSSNQKYYFRITAKDNIGNETSTSSAYTGNFTTRNINDCTPSVTQNTASWSTSKTMTIKSSGTCTGLQLQYKIGSGSWTNTTTGSTFKLSSNNTVYARMTDGTNVTDPAASLSVTTIDTTAPTVANNGTITTTTAGATVPIKITENQSGWASTKCEYGTSTSYGSTSNTTGTSKACSFTKLTHNQKYYFRITAKDAVGNETPAASGYTGNFTTKNISECTPSVTQNSSSWTTSKTMTISASGTCTGLTLQYKIGSSGTWTNITSGGTFKLSSNNTVYARMTDGTNVTNPAASLSVTTIDTSKPSQSFAVQSKTDGSNSWYKAMKIRTTLSDTGGSGVASAKYCITTSSTCSPGTSATLTTSGSNKYFDYDLGSNASAQRICVQTWDTATNSSTTSCSDAYKVDVNDPGITWGISSSTAGTSPWYKALTLKATVADTGSGIASIKYCTTTSSSTSISCTPGTAATASNGVVTLPAFGSNSSYQGACMTVTDTAGRSKTTCSTGYKVDASDPSASVTVATSTTTATVGASCSDGHSGITKYEFSKDNGSNWVDNGTTSSYKFTGLTSGSTSYNFKVRCTNGAGRTGTSSASNKTIGKCPTGTTNCIIFDGVTRTPSNTTYAASVKANIKYDSSNITNLTRYWKVNVGNVAKNDIAGTPCGTSTNPGTCSGSLAKDSYMAANTWYTTTSWPTVTIDKTVSSITLYGKVHDGNTFLSDATYTITKIDATAPTTAASISSIATSTTTATISASTCADSDSGITKYEYGYSTSETGTYTYKDNSKITGLTSGTKYYFKVRCTNGSGLTALSSASSATLGSTSNTRGIKFTSKGRTPSNTTWARQEKIDLEYTYSNITSPTRYWKVSVGGVAKNDISGSKCGTGTNPGTCSGSLSSGSYMSVNEWYSTGSWPTITVDKTTSSVTLYGRIHDGNTFLDSATYTITNIDATPPTCKSFSGGSTSWAKSRTISVECSDSNSGCSSTSFGKTYTPDKNTYITTGTPTITISDKAGNTTNCKASTTQNIYVDNTTPSVSYLYNPSNQVCVAGPFSLELTAIVSAAPVAYWQYSYSSSASTTGSDAGSQWVTYSDSAKTKFTTPGFSAQRNQKVYVRACSTVGNCSDPSQSYGSTYIRIGTAKRSDTACYSSVQGAINACNSGDVVTVLKDSTENVTFASGKTYSLDMNGKTLYGTITNNGKLLIKGNGYVSATDAVINNNGAELAINNGTFGTSTTGSNTGVTNNNGGTANLLGGTYRAINAIKINGGKVTIQNVTAQARDTAVWQAASTGSNNTIITNCSLTGRNSIYNASTIIKNVGGSLNGKVYGKVYRFTEFSAGDVEWESWDLALTKCPTWSVRNDQDDIVWHAAATWSSNVGTYKYCRINKSQHNNETGEYITHFYSDSGALWGGLGTWTMH